MKRNLRTIGRPDITVVTTITPCVLATLSRKDLDAALHEPPNLQSAFAKALAEHKELQSTVNRYGERNIDLVSGFAENIEIPGTYVSYSAFPREYSSAITELIVHVHTRTYRTCTTDLSISSKSRCSPFND